MNLMEYFKETEKIENIHGYEISRNRPRIVCADGFSMSVQGSEYHYSKPRRNGSFFYEVEIGYPSERVEEFMSYAEDNEKPTDTVYGYVPVQIVQSVIDKHGGIKEKG